MSGLHWVKSSFSDEGGNNCVELASTEDGIALRESECPAEVLATCSGTLGALLHSVKAGVPGLPLK
ncbi:DUF397 domain-containing protein [Streptomyces ipomoeae]|uniref:Putative toxin-antitoxin system, toxin component n=1 Tax=Streptomyces ipomoeae 91-03 TaxID=698759 RepID=L1L0J6_9ACTN|nr:DUF397 domain-containing protein [Streptomyces ipomoeae]EKX66148.1 putative toxin-antitoxin system, toxin component [Streptomyces ipomoeae 91-03]MDX2692695.1 DUF397 domain-containing protein [Streptomyces ipomoeae]MDX2844624.1 DUF397 domain-containing protein [Streptomyces ipomoeae]